MNNVTLKRIYYSIWYLLCASHCALAAAEWLWWQSRHRTPCILSIRESIDKAIFLFTSTLVHNNNNLRQRRTRQKKIQPRLPNVMLTAHTYRIHFFLPSLFLVENKMETKQQKRMHTIIMCIYAHFIYTLFISVHCVARGHENEIARVYNDMKTRPGLCSGQSSDRWWTLSMWIYLIVSHRALSVCYL